MKWTLPAIGKTRYGITLDVRFPEINLMPIRQRYHHKHSSGLEVDGARVGRFDGGLNTNFICYRIGGILIDSGPSNQWSEVKEFVEEKPVKALWLTHHHEDHSGNAGEIAKLYGLTPSAPKLAIAKLARGFKIPAGQEMIWGTAGKVATQALAETMLLENGDPVIPIHTPGHAKDLTCFYLPRQKWFFSGDLYLARRLKYMRADENLELIMSSLKKVLALDFNVVFCPHRGIDDQGYQGMQDKLAFLITLCQDSQDLMDQGIVVDLISEQLLGPNAALDTDSQGNFTKANLIREALQVDLDKFA